MTVSNPQHEADRLAVLRALEVLDTPDEAAFDALAASASRITGCSVALISLVDEDRQWFKARVGLDVESTRRHRSLCEHAIQDEVLFEVPDLRADARFADNPVVCGAPHLRFYAGQPLTVDGYRVGTLCVMDAEPRTLEPDVRELLAKLATAVEALLVSRQRLHQAQRGHERLVDFGRAGGDWMWESDADHRYLWLSESFEARTGLPAAEQVGRLISDVAVLGPDGQPMKPAQRYLSILDRHAPFNRVITVKPTPRGPLMLSRSGVPVFDASGRFKGYRGTIRDVTAYKATEAALHRKEEQWQLAAEAASLGLAQLHLAEGQVRLDARACANHGLAWPQEDFKLEDWLATIDDADRAHVQQGLRKVLEEAALFDGRYRVRWPDGSLRWLEFVVRASRDADGHIDGLIGTCRDVHEQQTAAQLERARDDAERANRAKSEFLSRLSHELRTPLNAILGFAQLMAIDREQPLLGRQAQRLASMQHAGAHLLGLINDVLEISRRDGQEPTWELRRVDIDAAIESAMGLVHPLAQLSPVVVLREHDPLAPRGAAVMGEPRRLEQVLMNLLSNAIKYSPPRSCVTVRVRDDGPWLCVDVIDEGRGLDATQLARLFQPFERLDAERQQVDGVGLGLYIARQLAEAMGGRVEVTSQVGFGSIFTLALRRDTAPPAGQPAVAVSNDAASLDAARLAAEGSQAASASATPKTIVYVEDESLNQLLFQEVVRSRPHWQLHLADDGSAGLRMAHEVLPDVMLIDINLPDTTGLALVGQLRRDPRTRALRCIALSADAMSEQIEAARLAGFDDYWTKPIHVGQVLSRLDEILREAD